MEPATAIVSAGRTRFVGMPLSLARSELRRQCSTPSRPEELAKRNRSCGHGMVLPASQLANGQPRAFAHAPPRYDARRVRLLTVLDLHSCSLENFRSDRLDAGLVRRSWHKCQL